VCADLLKAIGWARKYGLRINLDLHSVPGSQKCVLLSVSLPHIPLALALS